MKPKHFMNKIHFLASGCPVSPDHFFINFKELKPVLECADRLPAAQVDNLTEMQMYKNNQVN